MLSSPASDTQGPLSAQIGGGQRKIIGFWGGIGMKCCFINSSGAKSLESRLVAKILAGSSCGYRVGSVV